MTTKWHELRWPILVSVCVLTAFVFTPLGGIANAILIGLGGLVAALLLLSAAVNLFSFGDYSYVPFWKEIGLKIGGALALLLFLVLLQGVLPRPPAWLTRSADTECMPSRSNPC